MTALIRAVSTFVWLLIVRSAWTLGAIRGYAWLFKLDFIIPDWVEQNRGGVLVLVVAWLFFTYIMWDARRIQLKDEYDRRRREP